MKGGDIYGEKREGFIKKEKILVLKRWKYQIICVLAGAALGLVSLVGAGSGSEDGFWLERGKKGMGETEYELQVQGLRDEEVMLKLTLDERQYSDEEAEKVFQELYSRLPELIRGENTSLNEVRTDLKLVSEVSELGIRLVWQSGEPELLDSFGTVRGEGLEPEGAAFPLNVTMSDGKRKKEYRLEVRVCPPKLTSEQQELEEFKDFLDQRADEQSEKERVLLPDKYMGKTITYAMKQDSAFFQLTGLGLLGAVLLTMKEKDGKRKEEEARKQQMLMDHSQVLSQLIIFLGAGMSIRTAWDQLAGDYEREKRKSESKGKRFQKRYIYEEISAVSSQLGRGIPEKDAFEDFGKRCRLQPYIRLAGILEQSRKNGAGKLRDTLRLEMAEAFEQRRHQARRLGEEAGTKLLIPLFLMLAVVMVMIAVPAWLAF